MKLSEQIAQTCCGVLADKQEMVDAAIRLEFLEVEFRLLVEELELLSLSSKGL